MRQESHRRQSVLLIWVRQHSARSDVSICINHTKFRRFISGLRSIVEVPRRHFKSHSLIPGAPSPVLRDTCLVSSNILFLGVFFLSMAFSTSAPHDLKHMSKGGDVKRRP